MIAIREARDTDAAYVAATALRQVPRFVRSVARDDLALAVRALLAASRIVIACSETDDDAIVGWCAAIGGVPWFAFVPLDLRGNGIATRLRRAANGDSATSIGDSPRRENGGHLRDPAIPSDRAIGGDTHRA
jgi:hypothetical protein